MTTPRQFLASALNHIRNRNDANTALRDTDGALSLFVLEEKLAQSTSDLEFYATLRNHATACINLILER